MKLSFLLLSNCITGFGSTLNGQGRITPLKLDGVEIARVLNTIEKQSNYRFLYNSRLPACDSKAGEHQLLIIPRSVKY